MFHFNLLPCILIHLITVDDSRRSDEGHQESERRRLLYIQEEMKIYCDRPIVTSNT